MFQVREIYVSSKGAFMFQVGRSSTCLCLKVGVLRVGLFCLYHMPNLTVLNFSHQSAILMKDCDMMVDAALFLWSKCKPNFQRIMSSSLENCKQLLNDVFVNRVRPCPTRGGVG